jgi:uncharacterized membrane protein YgcG
MKLLLSTLILCLMAIGWGQPMEIRSFDSKMDWHADGSMDVSERIVVKFNEEKHGIYRVIPISLDNGKGSSRAIFLSKISCTGDDSHEDIKITKESGNERIRVGSADITFPPGTVRTYKLNYKVENAVNWFEGDKSWQPWAEMYWNGTGNEWEAPIGRVGLQITFPDVPKNTDVRARAFVGYYGSTTGVSLEQVGHTTDDDQSGLGMSLTKNTLTINNREPLEVGEGLTFSLAVPANLIKKPDVSTRIGWFLLPNLGFLLPIVALIAGALSYFWFGRDPSGGPMVVQFDPPDGLTGSEAGAFLDERVDQRDLAAGLITLAVNGYLTIQATKTGMIFVRDTATMMLTGKAEGPELTAFERRLLALLRKCPHAITETSLSEHVAPEVMELRSMLYRSLISRGYYRRSPETDRWLVGLGLAAVVGFFGFIATIINQMGNPLPAIIGFAISLPVIIYFAKEGPRRTGPGSKVWQKLRGFEEFMRRARANELEWMSKAQPDAALFEKYLPHAVAFGLTEQWANAFSGIVTQAPSWYVSPYGGPFRAGLFASDLNALSTSVASSAFTPPRSSGASGGGSGFSSGGGFSGGGFGGGGGGSW